MSGIVLIAFLWVWFRAANALRQCWTGTKRRDEAILMVRVLNIS